MDLFRYFRSSDMILEAGKFLGNITNTENTVVEDDMEIDLT